MDAYDAPTYQEEREYQIRKGQPAPRHLETTAPITRPTSPMAATHTA
jgi:hypothetical protein